MEGKVMAGLRRVGYPHLDELPSIDYILIPGKLRYQLYEWLFLQYLPISIISPRSIAFD
jgi:hypothetical protein